MPTVHVHPCTVARDIEGKILNRYAHRLLKLKVKYAEISMAVRPAPDVEPGSYRICISNEAGYLLKIHIYKTEEAPDTGILKFFSYNDSNHGYYEHVRLNVHDCIVPRLFRLFLHISGPYALPSCINTLHHQSSY